MTAPGLPGRKVSLTGIKPTSLPHLGNYLGAIRPALALKESHETRYFIADYHALTTLKTPGTIREHVYDVAATWVACGLDAEQTLLYRQSDVPEVFELMWVLACIVATGQLERGHAYKDAVAQGDAPNAGVFNYPLLMAADILLYDADVVPVGRDQLQHIELTRDLAERLNYLTEAPVVTVPQVELTEGPLVLGLDGRKMSKSYGNALPLFASEKDLKAGVMRIKTGSEPLEAPKDPEGTVLWNLYCHVTTEDEQAHLRARLLAGGFGWGHAKVELLAALEAVLGPMRPRFHALRADEPALDRLLVAGAQRARPIARQTLDRLRTAFKL